MADAVAAARSRRVLIDEPALFVGESHAAASGVYGGVRRIAVAAARSRRVSIDESRLFVGESYAATSGVYGGERRMP